VNEKDRLYLGHIAERIDRIEKYAAPGRNHFMSDDQAQDAIICNFEIIGEAVKRLSDQVLDRSEDIPWHQIAGFRNVLIHGYMDVDLDQVWNVIERYLPDLKEATNYLLK
jgi:uncharacterized protein with HEPN domain